MLNPKGIRQGRDLVSEVEQKDPLQRLNVSTREAGNKPPL